MAPKLIHNALTKQIIIHEGAFISYVTQYKTALLKNKIVRLNKTAQTKKTREIFNSCDTIIGI